jgi:hypothetical protein
MIETIILASLFILIALVAILSTQRKILKELKNIRIPPPQKIEFPKMEFPKIEIPKAELPHIEIPPAKEIVLDLNPVVEAVKNIRIPPPQKIEFPQLSITAELLQNVMSTQSDLVKILQEAATLMRVNQAEFQGSLEVFHKAIEKLLAQIPSGEKELNAQKEFMQKFEEAFVKVQETAAEAMSENTLRLQEILTEFLNKEVANK